MCGVNALLVKNTSLCPHLPSCTVVILIISAYFPQESTQTSLQWCNVRLHLRRLACVHRHVYNYCLLVVQKSIQVNLRVQELTLKKMPLWSRLYSIVHSMKKKKLFHVQCADSVRATKAWKLFSSSDNNARLSSVQKE